MATSPPVGTVTFLFTDIEGSSALWETHRAAMGAALARHDVLLRGAVEAHDGFVFATGGDGLAAAFSRAGDAVAAVVDAQDRLGEEAWPGGVELRVRMALLTGEADERDGNYFGEAVNRTARLMEAAVGGQVLLSSTTAGVVQALLPAGVELFDHGLRRLRSITLPEHVFELVLAGSAPHRSVRAEVFGTGRVVPTRVGLIGRDREVARVAGFLETAALVTLTGAGGIGKTSLALEVASVVADRFTDGVRVVELASLSAGEQVPLALAEALSLRPEAATPPGELVVRALARQDVLVVLDNCEHVIDVVSEVVAAITRRCPTVRVLATSREPLGLQGEHTFEVRPLSVDDAVRLFQARLADHHGGFDASESAEVTVLADLCRQLDRLPLAIELAAARARSMSLVDLGARLGERLRLLRGPRTAAARHQTLRETVAWSYDLLSSREQELFARLSVFSGGFTLAAAEAVCADDPWDNVDVDDILVSLADKSMLVPDQAGRYLMLETVRQFAEERLQEAGHANRLRDRHLAYFTRFSAAAHDGLQGSEVAAWWGRLENDWPNVRAAFNWAWTQDRVDDAAAIAVNLLWAAMWHDTGEPYAWITMIGEQPAAASSPLAASIFAGNALAAVDREEMETARSWGRRALDVERPDTPNVDYFAEFAVYAAASFLGDVDEAQHYLDQAVGRAREAGQSTLESFHTAFYATMVAAYGRTDEAVALARAAVELGVAAGNPTVLGWAMATEAACTAVADRSGAIALLEETVELAAVNHLTLVGWRAQFLLAVQRSRGREVEEAAVLLADALTQMRRKSSGMFVRQTLVEVVHVLHLMGDDERAATIYGSVRTSPLATEPAWAQRLSSAHRRLDATLGAHRVDELAAAGERLTVEQAARLGEEALHAWIQRHGPHDSGVHRPGGT